jgi:hypothetical protein
MFLGRRLAIICIMLATFQGCAGVPFKTLLWFHSLSPADFQAINPQDLSAAICLDSRVHLEANAPSLHVSLSQKDGATTKTTLQLQVIREGTTINDGLPAARPGQHWYLLALTRAGQDAMKGLQAELNVHQQKYKAFSVTISTGYGAVPEDIAHHFFCEARLRLGAASGFVTLYSGYRSIEEKS